VVRFPNWIVGNDQDHQIGMGVVYQLMCLTRLEKEAVAALDPGLAVIVPDGAGARDHLIVLPLGAM